MSAAESNDRPAGEMQRANSLIKRRPRVTAKAAVIMAALFALKAACLDGKSTEEAMEIGKRAGLKILEEKVREVLPELCS